MLTLSGIAKECLTEREKKGKKDRQESPPRDWRDNRREVRNQEGSRRDGTHFGL